MIVFDLLIIFKFRLFSFYETNVAKKGLVNFREFSYIFDWKFLIINKMIDIV